LANDHLHFHDKMTLKPRQVSFRTNVVAISALEVDNICMEDDSVLRIPCSVPTPAHIDV
jgi:hypothetical protein